MDEEEREGKGRVYLGGPSSPPSAAALPIYVTVDAWRGRSSASVHSQGFSFNYPSQPRRVLSLSPFLRRSLRRARREICFRPRRTRVSLLSERIKFNCEVGSVNIERV